MDTCSQEKIQKEKSWVILLSIVSNLLMVIIKLIIGLMTGLISVVAEALHSANDLLASLVAYFGVRGSLKPPDKDHPYGHGKIEMVTGWIENILILLVGAGIIYEGVRKLVKGTEPEMVEVGIVVMILSGVVNWFISVFLIKKGKELRSVGIEVDGEHLRADVITSLGIAVALIVMKLTGWKWLDPAGAIFVGIWVLGIFFRLSSTLLHHTIDGALKEEDVCRIEELIAGFPGIKDYHKLRTRHSGSTIFIDMHIKVDPQMTVVESHEITREMEGELKKMYGDVNVLIHVEPYMGPVKK